MNLNCLKYEERSNVGVLTFDDPSKKVNTLNSKLLPEFESVLAHLETKADICALVIISGKKDCFVAGADIEELCTAQSLEAVKTLSRNGQGLLNRLSALKIPTVAAIHGSCLGGGLELALACSYRIVTNSPQTNLGLPEVMLGLLPGAGGTQRLPRLIGLEKALSMILTGANTKPEKALKMGLVDYVCEREGLLDISIQAAKRLANKGLKRHARSSKGIIAMMEKNSIGRNFMFKKALASVMEKTRGLYPAPAAIIEVISYGLEHGLEKGLQKESEEFAKLSQTPEAKGLMSLYFAQTDLKKNRFGKPDKFPSQIGVLGAGLMGSGIAFVSLQKGMRIRLKDMNEESVGRGKKAIWKELASRVKRKSMTQFDSQKVLSLLSTQTDFDQFEHCDLVIEAVFEDIKLKHQIVKDIESHCHPNTVFASNTSALPISEIAKGSLRPENILGMHYFSPVQKMPLLEVIVTDQTSKRASALAVEVGIKQGKTVIVVKDGPGFYTTRILAPFMDEAAALAREGIDFHALDEMMQDFGYPVGPMTLIDEVGIDVAYHVAHDLGKAIGERITSSDPKVLLTLVENKILGRKSSKGFYLYEETSSGLAKSLQKLTGKKQRRKPINPFVTSLIKAAGNPSEVKHSREDMQKRMAYRMINEASYCLQEGILSSAQDGDIGAVFGLGFPPFRGGPFRYCDQVGLTAVVDDLQRFADSFGARFKPSDLLVDMAKTNKRFYA